MSSFKKQDKYIPERCDGCGQTMTYLLPVDRGTVEILKAVTNAILKKGINVIHPRKEMEVNPKDWSPGAFNYDSMIREGCMTSNMVGNLSRPKFHGLIAKTGNQPGNYCLTTKGIRFLKGKIMIPRYAIIDKTTGCQVGYWMSEKYQISIRHLSIDEDYWEGFYIQEGQVIVKIVKGEHKQLFLTQTS